MKRITEIIIIEKTNVSLSDKELYSKKLGYKIKNKRGQPLRFFDEYNQIVNIVAINLLKKPRLLIVST